MVIRRGALPVGIPSALLAGYLLYDNYRADHRRSIPYHSIRPKPTPLPRTRDQLLQNLADTAEYDILVIGGGATGTGIAWDAVTRGYKTALVEREDFSSETSSKSTKLVHGGVRYLEKAFWNLDYGQYKLVKEALAERGHFINMAPHLAFPLPIMIPVYKWWQLPYYYVGMKMYDFIAGKGNLEPCHLVSKTNAIRQFPQLNSDQLKGAIVYYDGSQNDTRMNSSLAISAIERGGDILNYCEVVGLIKDERNKVCGAEVIDRETNHKYSIKAKAVVNATGPFTDSVRKMDDPQTSNIEIGASGVHIVLPGWYCPQNLGLLDASTSDGRVVFFLPWLGSTIAGTTDNACDIEYNPIPQEKDIQFILDEVKNYIDSKIEVKREDVQAAWCGIRPLVKDPNFQNTESVVRSHAIFTSPSDLITIAGGKWTTFREMAEETVDKAIEVGNLNFKRCVTKDKNMKVIGAEGWNEMMYVDLIRDFNLDPDSAYHLSTSYGTRAFDVAKLCAPSTFGLDGHVILRNNRVSPKYPILDGEIPYAVDYEFARTPVDVIARRTRLAFLDVDAAKEALPHIVEVMADKLGWSGDRQQEELTKSIIWLESMGLQEHSNGSSSSVEGKNAVSKKPETAK